jgi:ABC-type glycerol-3-phosphate transport system substrate-binding protein
VSNLLTRLKRGLLFVISIIFITSSVSCSQQQVKKVAEKSEQPVLKIYLKIYDSVISSAIKKYNDEHIGVLKIEDTVIRDNNEFQSKMTTELLAGEGPDIIRIDTNLFQSIHKIVSTGIFCDLNKVNAQSKVLNIDDYYEKVMDRGVFDGKRYLIPIGYDIPTFFTTKEMLKKFDIQLDKSNRTWENLAKTVKTFLNSNNSKKIYFFYDLNFCDLMQSSGLSFVDYSKKNSKFSSKEFIELLNIYKDIYPSVQIKNQQGAKPDYSSRCSGDANSNDLNIPEMDSIVPEFLKTRQCVMFNGEGWGMGEPGDLRALNTGVRDALSEEMVVYPMPTFDGKESSYIKMPDLIGINSKCRYKKEALDFIKLIMSRDLEFGNLGSSNSMLSPINIKAYKASQKREMDHNIFPNPLPKSLTEVIDEIIGGIGNTVMYDETINKVVEEEATKFIKGKETAGQAAKAIDEKVNLYLNE